MQPNAKRIRSLREQHAWSQAQLAEIAGVSERTIQRVEQGETVGMETLKALASAFNGAVDDLIEKKSHEPRLDLLRRVTTGVHLFDITAGSHAARFNNDHLQPDMVDCVASFLQDLQDYQDIWEDIGIGGQIKAKQEYTERIAELEAGGLWVFAIRLPEKYKINDQITTWQVSTIAIVRSDNRTIISLPGQGELLPTKIVR